MKIEWRGAVIAVVAVVFIGACGDTFKSVPGSVGPFVSSDSGIGERPPPNPLTRTAGRYDSQTAAATLGELSWLAYANYADSEAGRRRLGLELHKRIEKRGLRVDVVTVPSPSNGPQHYVIAFRGTAYSEGFFDTLYNVIVDINATSPGPISGAAIAGKVHRGFNDGLDTLWNGAGGLGQTIAELPNAVFWLTGHSMGGAFATLAGARLAFNGHPIFGIYAFGSPRVGDIEFRDAYNKLLGDWHYRVTYASDVVSHLPPRHLYERQALNVATVLFWMKSTLESYRHVGRFCWYDRDAMTLQGGYCESAGTDAGQYASSWQQDMENVMAQGYFSAIEQMTAEHMAYDEILPVSAAR